MSKFGFLGLGTMGLPMAINMARAGLDLMVYNRTRSKTEPAVEAGAILADSPEALFDRADTVVMMLSGPPAVDATLGRLLGDRRDLFNGKLVVNMGTNPPAYSRTLAERLDRAGAIFVDAPVFGSKVPAEEGALVVMASGPDEAIDQLTPVFNAVGNKAIKCGEAPKASMMKLAVTMVQITMIVGLAEGIHFAKQGGLDLETFFGLILNGPIGNSVYAMKAKKILEEDYSEQASILTGREVLKHVADTAYDIGASVPNTLSNLALATMAVNRGLGDEDACALFKVFE